MAVEEGLGSTGRVEVGLSAFVACLNGVILRYVVTRVGSAWSVTDVRTTAVS